MPTSNDDLGVRLAVLEERLKDVQTDVRDLVVVIQGPPREESIRGRLHRLESADAAANAAAAALATARELHARALTRMQKIVLASMAVIGTVCTVITTIVTLTHFTG